MSEGEGGYKPTARKEPVNRRDFLKGMLKAGAGAIAVAAGVEIVPGQEPNSAEATSSENAKTQKIVMLEDDSAEVHTIGANFRILADPKISEKDRRAVQLLHFEQISGTAVSVSQLLIDKALSGSPPTQEQNDEIRRIFTEAQEKIFQMLASKAPTPMQSGLQG